MRVVGGGRGGSLFKLYLNKYMYMYVYVSKIGGVGWLFVVKKHRSNSIVGKSYVSLFVLIMS